MTVLSRYLTLAAFGALIFASSAAYSTSLDDCRKFIGKAALAQCTRVINDQKESPRNRSYAQLLRARAEMDVSDLEKAEADLADGLAAAPDSAFGYRLRGRLRDIQQRPAEARADYTKALQLSDTPNSKYLAYLDLGQFLTHLKEYPEALADLDAAIHLDGLKAAAYVSRSIVYREMGNIDAALASLESAASAEPAYGLTYVERGGILLAQKRFTEAVTAFDIALDRRPNDLRAQHGRAAAIAAGGTAEPGEKPEESKVAMPTPQPAPAPQLAPTPPQTTEHASSLPSGQTPGTPDPAAQAAELRKNKLQNAIELRNGRKFDEALAIYEAMLKAAPTDLDVAIERGRTLFLMSRWEDAMKAFKGVIDDKGTPDSTKAVALAMQSEILASVNQFDQAIKVANEAVRLNPHFVQALFWRGFSEFQTGVFAAAFADFQQAETLTPEKSVLPGWEAFALIGAGDLEKAKEAIARSFAAEPDNVGALHARSRLHLVAGDIAAAEVDFAQVMNRNPQAPLAVETQQLIMLHKIMKPTDSPLTLQPR